MKTSIAGEMRASFEKEKAEQAAFSHIRVSSKRQFKAGWYR